VKDKSHVFDRPEIVAQVREQIDAILSAPGPDVTDRLTALMLRNMQANAQSGVMAGVKMAAEREEEQRQRYMEPDGKGRSVLDLVALARFTWEEIADDLGHVDPPEFLATTLAKVMEVQRQSDAAVLLDEAERLERIVASAPYVDTALAPIVGALKHVARFVREGMKPTPASLTGEQFSTGPVAVACPACEALVRVPRR
jgi:hypothetical protein